MSRDLEAIDWRGETWDFMSLREYTNSMDDSIKRLIQCEEEARERVEQMRQYKEGMKRQALHDAELLVQMIESENEQAIECMKGQSEEYIEALKSELDDELRLFESEMSGKSLDSLVDDIVRLVSGAK